MITCSSVCRVPAPLTKSGEGAYSIGRITRCGAGVLASQAAVVFYDDSTLYPDAGIVWDCNQQSWMGLFGTSAKIAQVETIPRTNTDKIVEIAVREAIHRRLVRNLGALANPEALELFRDRSELLD